MPRTHIKISTLIIAIIISISSCTTYQAGNSGNIPPGKAKKMTGSKSAKPFAPGQQKKKR